MAPLSDPTTRPCQLHNTHTPKPLVTVKHHRQPLGCGGPDEPDNWLYCCDTGHRDIHHLMGPLFNGQPMPKGGTKTERAAAADGYARWVTAGRPGDPHAAYGLHGPTTGKGNPPMPTDSAESLEPESHHAPSAGELRNILRQLVAGQHETNRHLHRMGKQMATIDQAVTDLQTIDTAVLAALSGGVQQLQAQLAQTQADLAALQSVDADNVAARDDALAKLAASQADTQAAADSIEVEVSKLNTATGTTPTPDQPPAAS